ncbi:hypothetical protein [Kineosporia babensis]|uniref:Uncharacterized protein n=1 Tax=Kineosporia babensis TaxID=499548 RepID=A0A9X1NKH8_9ACTN|nr:hypothetical protein [Kineosporia babensis]MCD5315833.1 hypothetical protein [Kineosporia babensis]
MAEYTHEIDVRRQRVARAGPNGLVAGGERRLLSGELDFGGPGPDRDTCWWELGPRTRERLVELAGPSLQWWAVHRRVGGRTAVEAGLLGRDGFVFAEPRLNTERQPVAAIHAYLFRPGSSRQVAISWKPERQAPGRRSGGDVGPSAASAGKAAVRLIGLSELGASTLGAMPPKAQHLLLEPFVQGERLLRSEIYYWGSPNETSIFVTVLAGEHTVTSATGSRFVPAGHEEATAHWDLVCRRADVARRIGR